MASITNGMNYRSEYGYDAVGRNTAVRDANNNQSTVQFDTLGNVTRLAGPLGGATNYTYDQMGRLIAETTASGGTVTYGYNELSVKEQLTNAKGQVRKFFYNAKGQITGYVGVEDSVSYTYDANGNVLTVTDKNGTVSREYDVLNRVTKYTDTFGKVIQYEYDAVGNLVRLIYPDNTAVNYTYDANNNLVTVSDWASRVTSYTYDVNNRCIGVVKPDGSITTTVYDNKQRVTSTIEKTATNVVISGFEYTYDALSRITEEKHLANSTKICYTYDSLDRVTKRVIYNECDEVVSEESYTYDAAGNITDAPNSCFGYDTNNRLTVFNGYTLDYDLDGNLLCDGTKSYEYDSANRLIKVGDHAYTYNAEDVRIRNLCSEYDTTYTYNTNCKLSQLLMKNTNGIVTKYVYGKGLIGEQKCDEGFKTYHFDYRGSTVAITNQNGNITDTFKYDTYGKLISRTGNSFVIFGYNGRDGVVTDKNGLIYMRARYYSPVMRRFINADIIPGDISDSTSLNRYAYVNGNPVSLVDPLGLSFLLTLGLIAIGAVIGGTVSAVISVAEQKKKDGDVNWKEVAVDAAWGALDGGISASPLGFVGKTISGGVISAGQSITDQYFDSESKEDFDLSDVDYLEVGTSVAIDVGFSFIDIKAPNKTKELSKTVSSLDNTIARESRRANKKVANKRIAKASLEKSEAIQGAVTDMIIDPFKPKQVGNYIVNSAVNKFLFEEDEEVYSRK